MIWVTFWLAVTGHIFPRESQCTLTIFAFGVMHIQISFVTRAFTLTANNANRTLRRVVAIWTFSAIVFRVLFADIEVAVFRAEFAPAGARATVAQVARVTLRETVRMATPNSDRLYF